MSDGKGKSPRKASTSPEQAEINNEDFQFVLKALLAAFQPILAEQLTLAGNLDQLKEQAESRPPNCADELAEANRLFGKFFTEDVALRMIPPEGRKQLGPIENWRWCLAHLRCCFVFGWLVCRGPRTFRAWTYYVHQYWLCIRESLGTPVSNPPTEEQRQDFSTLVEALAKAYKPYLTDQLASVEFRAGIPDEVLTGDIDCFEGREEVCDIFERLLTVDTAQALLGRDAFAAHSQEASFWFCRCWCLCAMCFGCCLARARSFADVVWCLVYFSRCLGDCFRPLICAITQPQMNACAVEQYYPGPNVEGIEIVGTATGAFCDHYTLEWKDPLAPPSAYTQTGIVYAPPAPPGGPGACGKVNAPLGYLDTLSTPVPDDVEVRLTVFSAQAGQQPCVATVTFQIFRQRVSIEAVEGVQVETPPGWPDPNAPLINTSIGQVASFGTALEIWGHAWVGICAGKQIKGYTLSYQADFINNPTFGVWTQFWQVDYTSAKQQAAVQTGYSDLTSFWQFVQVCPVPPCPPHPLLSYDQLLPTRWVSGVTPPAVPAPQFFPVDPQLPPIWASQSLPFVNCYSGKYTLRLTVEDTLSNKYYDTQHVWFDNKAIYGEITGILGVAPCAVINLSQIPGAGDCTVPWPLAIQGIAYDEYIIEGDTTHPSDNFGGYCLTLTRQGGTESGCTPILLSVALPVPGPSSPTSIGTNRVGDPGTRCLTASPPPMVIPPKQSNTLTVMDARMFDATCAASALPVPPAGFALKRADPITGQPGECCAFFFALDVWDTSICPSLSGGRHETGWIWPIYICNDLPPKS
ncbi:MAG TPA: hypothetical protein VKZ50_22190 [bacterium]|nr:hypothetical protein [bacterium]